MPKARQPPNDKQVEYLPRRALAVAAERNVDIFAEPCSERDVPPAPEVGHASRHIRIVEVFQKLKAEHFAHAYRHIGVAREVEINLEHKRKSAQPRRKHRRVFHDLDRVPQRADIVCQKHFFAKTYAESLHPLRKLFRRAVSVFKLLRHALITHDGSRDKLRKHRDVSREVDDVFLHLRVVAVNVYRIGHRLERVERNAYRKRKFQKLNVKSEYVVDIRQEEVEILEKSEYSEVQDNGNHKHRFCRALLAFCPI